jgi:hypothetical protein
VRRGGRRGRWPARWRGWAGALGGGYRGDAAARRVGRTARGPDLGLSGLSSGVIGSDQRAAVRGVGRGSAAIIGSA